MRRLHDPDTDPIRAISDKTLERTYVTLLARLVARGGPAALRSPAARPVANSIERLGREAGRRLSLHFDGFYGQ